jgi:hypothetical protein
LVVVTEVTFLKKPKGATLEISLTKIEPTLILSIPVPVELKTSFVESTKMRLAFIAPLDTIMVFAVRVGLIGIGVGLGFVVSVFLHVVKKINTSRICINRFMVYSFGYLKYIIIPKPLKLKIIKNFKIGILIPIKF